MLNVVLYTVQPASCSRHQLNVFSSKAGTVHLFCLCFTGLPCFAHVVTVACFLGSTGCTFSL